MRWLRIVCIAAALLGAWVLFHALSGSIVFNGSAGIGALGGALPLIPLGLLLIIGGAIGAVAAGKKRLK